MTVTLAGNVIWKKLVHVH